MCPSGGFGRADPYVDAEPSSLALTSPEGEPLRQSNFNRRLKQPAGTSIGLVGFRFHDLRRTGNTFAASTGASARDLMARIERSSSRVYQHATRDRVRALADALSRLAAQPEGGSQIFGSSSTQNPNAPQVRPSTGGGTSDGLYRG